MSRAVDYARLGYRYLSHHKRLARHVAAMPKKLVCQDCGGFGGEVIPVLDYGQGPFETCGYCEGLGYVTRWMRGVWLRHQLDKKFAAPPSRHTGGKT